jgi:hypothetical protein
VPDRAAHSQVHSHPRAGRIVLVEPNELTRWSVCTYLRRWFSVDSASTVAGAERLLRAAPITALVISDQIASGALERLVQFARRINAEVRSIVMVTSDDAHGPHPTAAQIEKPFALPDLARLLGVPAEDLAKT